MHDEAFTVRQAVMRVVARLAHRAPLSVMPVVRKCIGQQMELLEYSDDARVKEEAIQLLECLAHGAGSLVEPYVPSIMQHMLRQLLDPSAPAAVVCAALAGVGELSLVSHSAVQPHMSQLMVSSSGGKKLESNSTRQSIMGHRIFLDSAIDAHCLSSWRDNPHRSTTNHHVCAP